MNKYLMIFAAALFSAGTAGAGQREAVEGCLKGTRQTKACYTMIANYWKHAPVIERAACMEGVDPRLMKSLIAYESTYNHRAVSRVNATGLTQVMPATAKGEYGLSRQHLYHPETSVRAGARYLEKMYRQFGRLDLALAAYNAGPGRVKSAGNRIPNIRETKAYVNNVTALYSAFKQKFPGQQCGGHGTVQQTSATRPSEPLPGRVALPDKPTYGQYGKSQKQANRTAKTVEIKKHNGLRFTGKQTDMESESRFSRQNGGIYSN